MRQLAVLIAALGFPASAPARAQDPDTARVETRRDAISPELAREIAEWYNAPGTLRVAGSMDVGRERTITGDVAVTGGPTVTIGGRVTGRVLAINADVVLLPDARVDGDLLIVGGRLEGRTDGSIGGTVRVYRQSLSYHMEGDRLVPDRQRDDGGWRLGRIYDFGARTVSRLSFTATPYNRVEGLPVHVGPTLVHRGRNADVRVEVLGILRSVDEFEWSSRNVGHRVFAEARFGHSRGIAIGGSLFDVMEPVERWHLKDTEAGLAAFFLHRDYRDYYERHGAGVHISTFAGDERSLTLGYRDERWRHREARDPFTLFRDDQEWRPNPFMFEGPARLLTAEYRYDTRNDDTDPWTGWFLTADLERGRQRVQLAPGTPDPLVTSTWVRGFADMRRYNRLSPDAQLNMRLVLGGRLAGDPLPVQRRFSVGGPGTLPGFDFRDLTGDGDVGHCTRDSPAPERAACERVILAQLEYRGALGFGRVGLGDLVPDWWSERGIRAPQWVAFADAGRGWLVGEREGELQYPSSTILPPLHTFRTDVGLGIDMRVIGLYVAKAVSHAKEPANFFVRVRHRF